MTGRTIGISLGVLAAAAIAVVTFKVMSVSREEESRSSSTAGATATVTATIAASGEVHPALVVVDRYLSSTHRLPPTLGVASVGEAATEDERQALQASLRDERMNAAWKCLQSTGNLDAEIDGTQDDPLSYSVALANAASDRAKVDVIERFGDDHKAQFDVALIDGRWLITATSDFDPATIDCNLEPSGESGGGDDDL